MEEGLEKAVLAGRCVEQEQTGLILRVRLSSMNVVLLFSSLFNKGLNRILCRCGKAVLFFHHNHLFCTLGFPTLQFVCCLLCGIAWVPVRS